MKKILATACAALLAGTIAWGANVYSVNAVGYVKQDLPEGFTMVAPPFSAIGGESITLGQMFGASVPGGTVVFVYVPGPGGGYVSYIYYSSVGHWIFDDGSEEGVISDGEKLTRGEGFWVQVPSGQTLSMVASGEVPGASDGTNKIDIVQGFQILAPAYPANLMVSSNGVPMGGLTPNGGDTIFQWNSGTWNSYTYYSGAGLWAMEVGEEEYVYPTLVLSPGSAFWYLSQASQTNTWNQTKPYAWP
jgi:hypothetical protein